MEDLIWALQFRFFVFQVDVRNSVLISANKNDVIAAGYSVAPLVALKILLTVNFINVVELNESIQIVSVFHGDHELVTVQGADPFDGIFFSILVLLPAVKSKFIRIYVVKGL